MQLIVEGGNECPYVEEVGALKSYFRDYFTRYQRNVISIRNSPKCQKILGNHVSNSLYSDLRFQKVALIIQKL